MSKWDDYNAWCGTEAAEDPPYVVHVAGPDDVLPARSWREAVAVANGVNADIAEYTKRTEHDGMVRSWATPYLSSDYDYCARALLAYSKPPVVSLYRRRPSRDGYDSC